MSTQTKILAALLMVSMIALTTTATLGYFIYERTLSGLVTSRFEFIATELKRKVEAGLDLGLPLGELENVNDLLRQEILTDDALVRLSIENARGIILFDTDTSRIGTKSSLPWLDSSAQAGPESSDMLVREIQIGIPLVNSFGKVVGGLLVDLFERLLRQQTRRDDPQCRGGDADRSSLEQFYRNMWRARDQPPPRLRGHAAGSRLAIHSAAALASPPTTSTARHGSGGRDRHLRAARFLTLSRRWNAPKRISAETRACRRRLGSPVMVVQAAPTPPVRLSDLPSARELLRRRLRIAAHLRVRPRARHDAQERPHRSVAGGTIRACAGVRNCFSSGAAVSKTCSPRSDRPIPKSVSSLRSTPGESTPFSLAKHTKLRSSESLAPLLAADMNPGQTIARRTAVRWNQYLVASRAIMQSGKTVGWLLVAVDLHYIQEKISEIFYDILVVLVVSLLLTFELLLLIMTTSSTPMLALQAVFAQVVGRRPLRPGRRSALATRGSAARPRNEVHRRAARRQVSAPARVQPKRRPPTLQPVPLSAPPPPPSTPCARRTPT